MEINSDSMRDKFEGCLLGGAAGDALGYAIEFWREPQIFSTYGNEGIRTLKQAADRTGVAYFSDDTQMTLFTSNGITCGMDRTEGMPGIADVWLAYREWLGTQNDRSRIDDPTHPKMWLYDQKCLHALRAPGNTCLAAVKTSKDGGTIEKPVNDSKGCGGVMRVAPIGLFASAYPGVDAMQLAAEAAALTHGHPLGWLPAAMLGDLVAHLVHIDPNNLSEPLSETLYRIVGKSANDTARHFARYPQTGVLGDLVTEAMRLSREHSLSRTDEVERIHQLGEGWVGEEALAIALYAVLSHPDDPAAALRCAVNHNGDSDSTGAVAGNIVGALWGRTYFEQSFDLTFLEQPALIAKVADDLLAHCEKYAGQQRREADGHWLPFPPRADDVMRTSRSYPDVGMPYTPLTKLALRLSFEAHKNQVDKSGLPYVYHPFHLAEQMPSEETACVALLHDVVEDGHFTLDELRERGMPETVVENVAALTRGEGVPYIEYVLSLRDKPVAREVKLADLRHNANLARLDHVQAGDLHRIVRYRIAQALLDDADDTLDMLANPPEWRKHIALDLDGIFDLIVAYTEDGHLLRLELEVHGDEEMRLLLAAEDAPKMRDAFNPSRSLPEGLADALEHGGIASVLDILSDNGIPFEMA